MGKKENNNLPSVTHPVGEDKRLWDRLAGMMVEKVKGLKNRHGESLSEAAVRAAESYAEKQRIDNATQEAKIRESHAKAEHEAELARQLRAEEARDEIRTELLREEARGLKLENDKREALEKERVTARLAEKEIAAQEAAWTRLKALKDAGIIELFEQDGELVIVHNGHIKALA